jgi:hypothetical protein
MEVPPLNTLDTDRRLWLEYSQRDIRGVIDMSVTLKVVYKGGVFRPLEPVNFDENQELQITIAPSDKGEPLNVNWIGILGYDPESTEGQDTDSSESGNVQATEAEAEDAGRSDGTRTPPPPEKAERALEEWLLAQERSPDSDWNAYIALAERFARDASKQHLAMLIEDWAEHHVSGEGDSGSEE